jgi:hypothetical protein
MHSLSTSPPSRVTMPVTSFNRQANLLPSISTVVRSIPSLCYFAIVDPKMPREHFLARFAFWPTLPYGRIFGKWFGKRIPIWGRSQDNGVRETTSRWKLASCRETLLQSLVCVRGCWRLGEGSHHSTRW